MSKIICSQRVPILQAVRKTKFQLYKLSMDNFLQRLSAIFFTTLIFFGLFASLANGKNTREICTETDQIVIGYSGKHSSNDPQLADNGPNNNIAKQVFNTLVEMNEDGKLVSSLAIRWKNIGNNTWELDLRSDVRFHDGSLLTAADIKFSYQRVIAIKSTFKGYLASIEDLERDIKIVDDHKIQIRTSTPSPLLLNGLALIPIVSKNHTTLNPASTADFNTGKSMIGTGPYIWKSGGPGGPMEYEANPKYFGTRPTVMNVKIVAADDEGRLQMLNSGTALLIDNIPPDKFTQIKSDPQYVVSQATTNRVLFLTMDQFNDNSPFVTDSEGKPITNPFKDKRVREAFSLLIDRDYISKEIMAGLSAPAAQFAKEGTPGSAKGLKVSKKEIERAKFLIDQWKTENNIKGNIQLVLHGPAGRFPNDVKIVTAIGKMLEIGGIVTKVETMPINDLLKQAREGKLSVVMAGWGIATNEANNPLQTLVYTMEPEKGKGVNNFGRVSVKDIDELVDRAKAAENETERNKLIEKATRLAVGGFYVLPIHHIVTSIAVQKGRGYVYNAQGNEMVLPSKIKHGSDLLRSCEKVFQN